MTFRIDHVFVQQVSNEQYVWHFDIKGLFGHGLYTTLLTDDTGRGLRVANPNSTEMRSLRRRVKQRISSIVARKDCFQLAADAGVSGATRVLARTLLAAGWGPWIAADHSVLAQTADEVQRD